MMEIWSVITQIVAAFVASVVVLAYALSLGWAYTMPIFISVVLAILIRAYKQRRNRSRNEEESVAVRNTADEPNTIHQNRSDYDPPRVYQQQDGMPSPSAPTADTAMRNYFYHEKMYGPSAPTADTAMQLYIDGMNPYVPGALAPAPPPVQRVVHTWDDPVIIASRLPFETIKCDQLIGRGAFADVYRGWYRHETVAIKKLRAEIRRDLKRIAAVLVEAKFMANLEHDRIVRLIGVAWDALSDLGVVCEYMEGGDLRGWLDATNPPREQGLDHEKLTIAIHVAEALTFMHSLSPVVVHRDLKSRNILLDRHFHAKLADFGVARQHDEPTMTARMGTIRWMAPEVMRGESYDAKADVFSFGVVLSELDTHAMPYAEARDEQSNTALSGMALLQSIMAGRTSVQWSAQLPPRLGRLAQLCVALNPMDRPTAAQVLYELQVAARNNTG